MADMACWQLICSVFMKLPRRDPSYTQSHMLSSSRKPRLTNLLGLGNIFALMKWDTNLKKKKQTCLTGKDLSICLRSNTLVRCFAELKHGIRNTD